MNDNITPPGEHELDPANKDVDPLAFALDRVQTYLVWIDDHRAAFEKHKLSDTELANAELANLRHSTLQAMLHTQRLSELLLVGYCIDPTKRMPDSLQRRWFQSVVIRLVESSKK